jgi:hypothetical protein
VVVVVADTVCMAALVAKAEVVAELPKEAPLDLAAPVV